MRLAVDANISDSTDLFDKTVSDLQENVAVSNGVVAGTLKYVADYSSAYGTGEDSGNYLVLHFSTGSVSGATIKAKLFGGKHGWATLDSDGILITRITDKNSQTITVVADKEGYEQAVMRLSLKGLTLASAT